MDLNRVKEIAGMWSATDREDESGRNVLTIDFANAVQIVEQVFSRHGFSAEAARTLARNVASAERDGSRSHGLFRLKDYLSTVACGYVNPRSDPVLFDAAPGFMRVDADNGFAQVAMARARAAVTAKARRNGVAVLAIRNSHHLGALYLDVESFAAEGLLAIAVVNSIAVVAPPGAKRGVYGTNPMAFAAPCGDRVVVFDQASSTMAHGDVRVAAAAGHSLSPHAGIDAAGNETADPQAILDGGALLTFGGYKGASIALMIELLCAALVGADFSFEVSWEGFDGAQTARTGETLILIDPQTGAGGLKPFADRAAQLAGELKNAGQSHLPGERRLLARKAAGSNLVVSEDVWRDVVALAAG